MDNMMVLLMASSVFTALVTEAIKKTFSRDFNGNLLAAAVSILVAGLICIGYIVMHDIVPDAKLVVQVIALIILSWLCAMVGYDKVKEAITKIGG